MATQQEQRRRLRQRSQNRGGGASSSQGQGRGGRLRNTAKKTASATKNAATATGRATKTGLAATGARLGSGLRMAAGPVGIASTVAMSPEARSAVIEGGKGVVKGLKRGGEDLLDLARGDTPGNLGSPSGITEVGGSTRVLSTDVPRGQEPRDPVHPDRLKRGESNNPYSSTLIDKPAEELTPEEIEAATTPGAEDPAGAGGRERIRNPRPTTLGPDGTVIDTADVGTEEAAQFQGEAMAPGLPGVPEDEQEIIRVRDGNGGVGTVRAQRGLRQGGGTFSTMKNIANAAVPVDTQGLHEARMAAVRRGERLPSEGGGPSRRERLRREIRQTRGLDQTLSSAMAEGLRRRSARSELDSMDAQAIQDSRNAAAMARERLGRQPTALEVAEEQRARQEAQQESAQQQRENERLNRESTLETMNSRFVDSEGDPRADAIDQYMGILERSEVDHSDSAQVRSAIDTIELADHLDTVAADTSGIFGTSILSDDKEPTMETIQASLGEVAAGLEGQYDDWGGDATIPWRGGVVRLEDLSEDMKQRLFNFRDRMNPNARTGSQ